MCTAMQMHEIAEISTTHLYGKQGHFCENACMCVLPRRWVHLYTCSSQPGISPEEPWWGTRETSSLQNVHRWGHQSHLTLFQPPARTALHRHWPTPPSATLFPASPGSPMPVISSALSTHPWPTQTRMTTLVRFNFNLLVTGRGSVFFLAPRSLVNKAFQEQPPWPQYLVTHGCSPGRSWSHTSCFSFGTNTNPHFQALPSVSQEKTQTKASSSFLGFVSCDVWGLIFKKKYNEYLHLKNLLQ